jgi:hypothetical protein
MNPADEETWPAREGDTAVVRRETLVGGDPPPPVYPTPPPPDRRIGSGMLLALTALALVAAGIAIAYFLTHSDNGTKVTTVIER